MLGYWNESIANPNKVLFLKYEDLKEDTHFHVKRIAKFLGCPFTQEEESNGVIQSIIKLCSFENMKSLEVNKSGKIGRGNIVKFMTNWVDILINDPEVKKIMKQHLPTQQSSTKVESTRWNWNIIVSKIKTRLSTIACR